MKCSNLEPAKIAIYLIEISLSLEKYELVVRLLIIDPI